MSNLSYLERYLSSRLIMCIDLLISALASLLALGVVRLVFHEADIPGSFAIVWEGAAVASSLMLFYVLKTYRFIIRHSTLREVAKFVLATLIKEIALCLCVVAIRYGDMYGILPILLLLDFLMTLCALVVIRVAMIAVYDLVKYRLKGRTHCQRVLIYGTGDKSVALITRLQNSPHYSVTGFLTYGSRMKNCMIAQHKVYYFERACNVKYLQSRYEIDAVLFATESEAQSEQERLLKYATDNGLKILIAPPIDEVTDGKLMRQSVREIKIEDLLGRPEIKISMEEIIADFRGKTVMVTGAAGSIGSELCRQLATFGVKRLVLFDNAETPMHNLRLELEERYPALSFEPVIGDIRLVPRLDFVFRTYRPQVVFHAAAYKHVPLMEENPCEAVLVNVAGSRNVADKCLEYDVEKMVMISTDKAVNPTNIMGCTKRLAEIYVQSLGLAIERGGGESKGQYAVRDHAFRQCAGFERIGHPAL